jgi:hypothetical protein
VFTSVAANRDSSDIIQLRCVLVPATAPSFRVLQDLRDVCDAMANRKTPMSLCACTQVPVGILLNVPIKIRVGGSVGAVHLTGTLKCWCRCSFCELLVAP